jgi:hypothetical protein
MYKCEASAWRFHSLPNMVVRESQVAGSGRCWSKMDFVQYSANVSFSTVCPQYSSVPKAAICYEQEWTKFERLYPLLKQKKMALFKRIAKAN